VTNLDDLKDAMHSPPDFEPRPLDLDGVMAAGGRLRRRRRLAVGSASALTVVALLVGGSQLLNRDAAPSTPAAAPGVVAKPSQPGVLGEVIDTGLLANGAEQVIYGVPVKDGPKRPDVDFGFMAGRRLPDGSLKGDVMVNETDTSARAPGFRGPEGPMQVEDITVPAFGYYVGPATRITVIADGREVTAQQAPWSEDPSVIVFWFDPAQAAPDKELLDLTAYDKDGKKLPAGNNHFAVG
jgi:hypothetical protein